MCFDFNDLIAHLLQCAMKRSDRASERRADFLLVLLTVVPRILLIKYWFPRCACIAILVQLDLAAHRRYRDQAHREDRGHIEFLW